MDVPGRRRWGSCTVPGHESAELPLGAGRTVGDRRRRVVVGQVDPPPLHGSDPSAAALEADQVLDKADVIALPFASSHWVGRNRGRTRHGHVNRSRRDRPETIGWLPSNVRFSSRVGPPPTTDRQWTAARPNSGSGVQRRCLGAPPRVVLRGSLERRQPSCPGSPQPQRQRRASLRHLPSSVVQGPAGCGH